MHQLGCPFGGDPLGEPRRLASERHSPKDLPDSNHPCFKLQFLDQLRGHFLWSPRQKFGLLRF